MIINDLTITSSYRVYDINSGRYIFTWDKTQPSGDIPPDIAMLPVIKLAFVGNVLYIDTTTFSY